MLISGELFPLATSNLLSEPNAPDAEVILPQLLPDEQVTEAVMEYIMGLMKFPNAVGRVPTVYDVNPVGLPFVGSNANSLLFVGTPKSLLLATISRYTVGVPTLGANNANP
jgi:hypothetical protein